jgi:hypothetical protein
MVRASPYRVAINGRFLDEVAFELRKSLLPHPKITFLLLGHIKVDGQLDLVTYNGGRVFCRNSKVAAIDRCGG